MAFSKAHICQCLSRISTLRRDSPVLIDGGRRVNGHDFAFGVAALARGLSEELGVGEGDVVAIAACNSCATNPIEHESVVVVSVAKLVLYTCDRIECCICLIGLHLSHPFSVSLSCGPSSKLGIGIECALWGWAKCKAYPVNADFSTGSYVELLLAIAFVGGIAAPLNYRWLAQSSEEARDAMELVCPKVLVVDDSCYIWSLELRLASLTSLLLLANPSSNLTNTLDLTTTNGIKRRIKGAQAYDYRWAPKDTALVCFTSGTTGRPKGVAVSHAAIIAQSLAKIAIVGYGENDVYLHTAPLCHIGGISSCMAMLMMGACHVFLPKFEARSAVQAIQQHRITSIITVPAMMADLVSTIREERRWKGGESVKKILNGGGTLSIDLINGASIAFPNAKLLSAYGMTEACSSLTFLTLHDPTAEGEPCKSVGAIPTVDTKGTCVGKPAPHVEVRISEGKGGEDAQGTGRILTRGPHVMTGYWGQSPGKARADGGWLDTGDIGWVDDSGNLWLVGRTKDRIKSGGENVYPQEVEQAISQHPGISGIVVVGVPDARLTEMVTACVRIKDTWCWATDDKRRMIHHSNEEAQILSPNILQNYCKKRNLTGFKIPKMFVLWSKPFPLTTTGKLKRDEVKREALSHFQLRHSNL
ncbi:hypothetical protein ACLOJK_021458 [Asimina triloba]